MPREHIARALHSSRALDLLFAARRRLRRPNIAALTYHHIADPGPDYPFDPDVADATPDQFRRHLELLVQRCTPIGIDELVAGLDGAPLPPSPVMITFDDGYRSNVEIALPILRELGVPAVFFVATAFATERRLYWWETIAYLVRQARRRSIELSAPKPLAIDLAAPTATRTLQDIVKLTVHLDVEAFVAELARQADVEWTPAVARALADRLIMTWDDVRALHAAGMDVESHGRRHRVLQTLDDDALADELAGSRADLERETGRQVRAIAYPVGRTIASEPRIRHAVAAAGYRVGFTNASGMNSLWRGVDAYDVRRLATDRWMSDQLLLAQVALPRLAYLSANHGVPVRR